MRFSTSGLFFVLVSAMMARASPVQTAVPQPGVLPRDATPTTATNPEITTTATTTTDDFGFHLTLETLNLNLPSNTCTPTIAPDKYGWVPPSECDALYLYYPSFGAAIAASVIFGILMIAHLVQATMYKAGFAWVVLMGTLWELVGYTTRAFSTRNQQNEPVTTSSQMFILLAPLWVNAFDYMVLARMIHFFVPDHRIGIFKPSLLAKIFVLLDIVSFVVQMIGGFMANGKGPEQMNGIHIYMGGVGVQEFFIIGFLVLAVQFHRLMLKLEQAGRLPLEKQNWRRLLYALYGSLFAITMRIIYRLVEFSAGTGVSNPIPYHEWYMYVFDGIPMALAVGVWNFAPPGAVLQGPDAKMPSSGIGKWLCCGGCCCRNCRKGKEKNMQRLPDHDTYGDGVPLHSREPSPYRDTYTPRR
ncbi:RTA-like protein [Penicillium cf. griseofulvum]|uniref:RTA-like protein n=1 Tax=Penicillium cf. griseofulvum TaxID=2972120 RepID=A0A9W9T2K9_9EURO|nr:RTA-like protein [Penicillium cf. griseofulvum]KAJ5446311.1 RTA-like protein [Penicillium cf. griseofulvum]KAJ5448054.1 RTA-like protein [Penicillium cf. griseofulvum]